MPFKIPTGPRPGGRGRCRPGSRAERLPGAGAAPCGFRSGTPHRKTAYRNYRRSRDTGTGAVSMDA